MATLQFVSNQSVIERMSNLPLLSSTYGLVSGVYSNTKDTHPYIRSMCEAAENGVRTITSVALITAKPLLGKLEPQIAIANILACKGLDTIERKLPILRQPSEQIVASAKGAVTSAREAVTGTVAGAKDSVSDTLSGVVGGARGAMRDGVEVTRAAVSARVGTVMESRVVRLVSSGVDTALSTSESLVDQYLPLTEDELELEAKNVCGFDKKEPSYYIRLGSLSVKLRKRAYAKAMAKVEDAKQRSQESISQLNNTVDLIQHARMNVARQRVYDKLNSLVDWRPSGSNQERNDHETEVIESRTLALAHTLTQGLQTTCLGLVSGLQGLPSHIQQEALSLSQAALQVYSSFGKAASFRDLPDSVLSATKTQLGRMKGSLDIVMDYLVNNTPLNWLVGPFYPRMEPSKQVPETSSQCYPSPSASLPTSQQLTPIETEMESLSQNQ